MVFESIVTELLNRFLGDYVENLDAKQLKLGIWGGDVELNNLVLKQTALKELDLPIQAVYGRLGKLVLKIPWKNLYYSPVIANIEGLYILAEPNAQVQYDAEKEEKRAQEFKQAELKRVEDAKKKALETVKEKVDDTFVEKLTTQIIRNVQISIRDIHVRYEDEGFMVGRPFAAGFTLSNLTLQTTNENWEPAIVYENITQIFKIVELEGLAVYWNCKCLLYKSLSISEYIQNFKNEIATKTTKPSNYAYILGPISSSARLILNQKPELDVPAFSIPKVKVNFEMEKLAVGITKAQFKDVIALADSMNLMMVGAAYRKHRPNVPYKGHYKQWWHFAYNCMLEFEVRRRRQNWNWSHMYEHRRMCREYAALYQTKLSAKKCPADVQENISKLEKKLDVFSLLLLRQKVELEVERVVKNQPKEQEKKSWFSWWRSEEAERPDADANTLVSQLQAAMTPEEKARLYKAIDYQGQAAPAEYPQSFVAVSCVFVLKMLQIEVVDDERELCQVLDSKLCSVKCKMEMRPAASALKVRVNIDQLLVSGMEQNNVVPQLITSEVMGEGALLDILFETNPVDTAFDQRVYVTIKPIRVIYDAQTIISIASCFTIPQSSAMEQLSEATANTINNVKTKSAAGLQHAIDSHTSLELKVDLHAPIVILPYGGLYTGTENILVINLGHVKIESLEQKRTNIREKQAALLSDVKILEALMKESYDQFTLELTKLQVLLVPGGEDWTRCVTESKTSDMHLLDPLSLNLSFYKCLVQDDPRLPFNKISGTLHSLTINMIDSKILLLMSLIHSIPFPENETQGGLTTTSVTVSTSMTRAHSSTFIAQYLEHKDKSGQSEKQVQAERSDYVQFTTLEANFILKELLVKLQHQEYASSPVDQVAMLSLASIECNVSMQTYVKDILLSLGYINFHKYQKDDTGENRTDDIIEIISTPICSMKGTHLFSIKFLQVDKSCPDFYTKHKACESLLDIEFAMLKLVLHQEALQGLVQYATDLQAQLTEITSSPSINKSSVAVLKRRLSSISETLSQSMTHLPQLKTPLRKEKEIERVDTITFKLTAKLNELLVVVSNKQTELTSISVKGVAGEVIMKTPYMQVTAHLQDLLVTDSNIKSKYFKIVDVIGDEAVYFQVVIYDRNVANDKRNEDILVTAKLGRLRIVFLNLYVATLLDFINKFQAAQIAILEASQAAAQQARQNVASVYENAIRVTLKINLDAPDIIIPQNSGNYEAIFLDLGHLTITNDFLALDVKNDANQSAMIDNIKLELMKIKVSRVKLDEKLNILKDITILKPVTFTIMVKRNLSTSWYLAVPDICISGEIEIIELELGQPDYKMIMETLNGNLAEGVTETPRPATVKSELQTMANVVTVPSSTVLSTVVEEKNEPEEKVEEKVHIFVKFNFVMAKFVISLFTIQPHMDPDAFDSPRCGLASFSLEGLSIKGRLLTDGTVNTSVLLVDCLLEDIRSGSQKALNRLFERKSEEALTCPSKSLNPIAYKTMIDVTFKKKDNDLYLDLRISSFTMILSMEFLSKVQNFFTVALAIETEPHVAVGVSKATSGSAQSSKTTVNKPPPPEPGKMTVNIKIEKPDIILVEKMTCVDTKALILNCEAAIKYNSAGLHQVIDGNVKDVMLYTCCYNPVKRKESMVTVLEPFSISITGATPEHKGLHLEVCITDIHICVSPATIDLLNRAYATLYAEEKDETSAHEDLFEDHSRMWEHQPYKDDDFWFLKTEYAVEAWELFEKSTQTMSKAPLSELCEFTVSSIVLSLEAGVGKKTLPMLLMESDLHGKAKNWSSKMEVEATLSLQMGYYNSSLAVWEPLLEPVFKEVSGQRQSRPWSLKLEVAMNNPEETPVQSPNEPEISDVKLVQPAMSISLTSDSNLELTVSKAALEVIWNLSKAFETVVEFDSVKQDVLSPYKFKNDTGIPVIVNLSKGSFELCSETETNEVLLENGAVAPLQLIPSLVSKTSLHVMTELNKSYRGNDHKLHVKIPDINSELTLSIMRADKRYFSLNHRGDTNESWGVILSTVVDNGVIIMTLSGILRVHNYFNIPVDVYYMTARGNELECIGAVEPGSFFNVPLKAVYTQTFELFFSAKDYSITSTPFVWKDLKLNLSQTQILQSTPTQELRHERPFIFKVIGEIEQVYNENSVKFTMQSSMYNINLYPTILFRNSLPIDVLLSVQDVNEEQLVKACEHCVVSNVNPGSTYVIIRIPSYLEKEWSCKHDVATNPPEFSVWTFDSYDGFTKMSLDLGIHVLPKSGSSLMSLYCPFWMLNKTGVNISYRSSDENLNIIHHPSNFKGPILFSFNAKNFFGKKKASVRIRAGEFSDKFSIDAAGSSGVVMCKENDKFYQLGVNIQLTYNGLTKQVTFTPFYVIINSTFFTIECQEHDRPADAWTVIEPKSCASFWPISEFDDKLIRLRVAETEEVSAPFLISESHTSLLKLQNKYGGVNVDIQLTEGAIYINLAKYELGMAPALIINHTKDTMNIWERDTVQLKKLAPGNKFFYTWDYPAGQRVLVWEAGYKEEVQDDLRKDGAGEYTIAKDTYVYWVSFLDGMQRVLLFTCDEGVAKEAQSSKQYEQIDQEVIVSIHGLGLSLVDNPEKREIMYMGIAPSGVIWETCKESLCKYNRYKQMSVKDSENMEAAYEKYLVKRDAAGQEELSEKVMVDAKTEVDFSLNTMYKPHKRRIRRTFLTGLWLQMRTNSSLMQLHGKINRLQIDNQMFDCIFPVVLAPVPPPKSVAAIDVHKPFAELSIVQLLIKHSQIKQFKYFKVLIQEFHIKLDLGFVNAVLSVIQGAAGNLEEEKQMFLKDMELVNNPLYAHVYSQSQQEQKSFYDLLHFSPLKIHVSFTVASSSSTQGVAAPNVINVLLQGLGVTLTDLQDVVFKLAYFEKEYTFLTQKQLTSEATSHYVGQAVKQLYVLVLGLDVLGNPYGLVLGITKGVEDLFYEPFQGAIQGPGEFAEGLALGVRSLFGHTVGGAAGAVSRITGAMGKGLATLTFDKDYQRKRRDQMNTKPQTVSEGLARSGKGLVMGVYDGVTGVFKKPISGAKEQGVGGFIKGLGKGAVGLVTRPTAGVMDFASSSLDTVKRVTELGNEEARRLRPPRFIQVDGVIRPYNYKESLGNKLLSELDKGKYANTDSYVSHYVIIVKKEILLLTDKRLAYISHNDLFGGWQMEWSYTWQELSVPPKVVAKGVLVSVGEGKKKKKGLFGTADTDKTILISNEHTCEQVCAQIRALQGPPALEK